MLQSLNIFPLVSYFTALSSFFTTDINSEKKEAGHPGVGNRGRLHQAEGTAHAKALVWEGGLDSDLE